MLTLKIKNKKKIKKGKENFNKFGNIDRILVANCKMKHFYNQDLSVTDNTLC